MPIRDKEDQSREKLIRLGAETLADALLALAEHSDEAEERVALLVTTPEEKLKLIKSKLSGLRRGRRFIDWRESREFARTLENLLELVRDTVTDPDNGLQLIADFFETDEHVVGRCDDSDGLVGDVYRHDASELFEFFAARCENKKMVADILFRLNQENEYGVRDKVIECAGRVLGEREARALLERFQTCADDAKDTGAQRDYLILIESMARQLGDAELFEKTRLRMSGEDSPAAWVDIARVYLECGDADTAFDRISRIPAGERFMAEKRDALLLRIYRCQGREEEMKALLTRMFRSYYSLGSLDALVAVAGPDQREVLIDEAVAHIRSRVGFSISDLTFLLDCGRIDEAEDYVLPRREQIDGQNYSWLPPLAETLEKEKRYAAASLIYRALLLSILERSYAKAYSHAARYLRKLDQLAKNVEDWKSAGDHQIFVEGLRRDHGRKASFWRQYED